MSPQKRPTVREWAAVPRSRRSSASASESSVARCVSSTPRPPASGAKIAEISRLKITERLRPSALAA